MTLSARAPKKVPVRRRRRPASSPPSLRALCSILSPPRGTRAPLTQASLPSPHGQVFVHSQAARFAPPRLPGREPVNVLPRFDESRLLLRSVQRGGERSDPTVEDRPGRLPVGVRLRHDEPCDGFLLLLTEYAQLS